MMRDLNTVGDICGTVTVLGWHVSSEDWVQARTCQHQFLQKKLFHLKTIVEKVHIPFDAQKRTILQSFF